MISIMSGIIRLNAKFVKIISGSFLVSHATQTGENVSKSIAVAVLKNGPIPRHIAFIMDGNRRFASRGEMAKIEGHALGFNTLKRTLDWCFELGVRYVTVYAFSIENFQRPRNEVDDLMNLAKRKFVELLDNSETLHKHKMGIRVLGDLSLLRSDVREVISRMVEETADNTEYILNICFPYTSQEEMATISKEMAHSAEAGDLETRNISEQCFDKFMYTAGCGDVEILVRTSGEIRLSDFMLWQSSFGLLMYRRELWPEFNIYDFFTVILEYQKSCCALPVLRRSYFCTVPPTIEEEMFNVENSDAIYKSETHGRTEQYRRYLTSLRKKRFEELQTTAK
eukprot:CFRG4911T1